MKRCGDCGDPAEALKRGRCNRCYLRWLRETPPEQRPYVRPGPDPVDRDERFDSYVDASAGPDACWPWTRASTGGYGVFVIGHRRSMRATHYALERAVGPPPGAEYEACHTCDNPPCCNPAHLYWGTRGQNMGDAVLRGRTARRERHGSARLTSAERDEVRRLYAKGDVTQDQLAKRFSVGRATVYRIVRGIGWQE